MNKQINQRHYGMDFLRASAMLLGIFYHAAGPFTSNSGNVFVQDINHSELATLFYSMSHIFRMPLFFVISGFFFAMLIERKGLVVTLKSRLKRISLPFLIFSALFIPVWFFLVFYAYKASPSPTVLIESIMLKANSGQTPSLLGLPIGHLWFLYYLMIFSLVFSPLGGFLIQLFREISSYFIIAIFVFSLTVCLYFSPNLNLIISTSFIIDFWSLSYYAIYFLIGFSLYLQDSIKVKKLPVFTQTLAIIVGMMVATFLVKMNMQLNLGYEIIVNLIYALSVVVICLNLISLANTLCSQASPKIRYISDASYWLYITHMPLLVYLQIRWHLWELNGLVKYCLLIASVLTPLFLVYHFMVRSTFIGKLLNGKKIPKNR